MKSGPREEAEQTSALIHGRWLTLAVTIIGTFMTVLDAFIVNVALPSIEHTIRASPADLELVLSSYLLVYSVFLITGGRLGDIFGRKKLFLIGMSVFAISSAMCGFSPNALILILSRAVQGFGAALMYPQILSIIQVTFDGEERAKALGLFAAANGLAAVIGQLFGGFLIQINLAGLAWRPIFLVNVPVGIAGVIAGVFFLKESKAKITPKLDLQGAGLITLALAFLVFPLVEGLTSGWPAWMLAMLVLSLPFLVLFVLYERQKLTHGGFPLIDIRLFKQRSFSVGLPLGIAFFSTLAGLFFILSVFLQDGLGLSPLSAGLVFTPVGVGYTVASLFTPQFVGRLGRRTLSIGYALDAIGYVSLVASLAIAGSGIDIYELFPFLLIVGLGNGFALSPLVGIVLAGTRTEDVGQASGMMSTGIQIGNTVGVAIFGFIFFDHLSGSNAPNLLSKYVSSFESTLIFFVIVATANFLLVLGLPKPGVGEFKDVLLERMPRAFSGLAYSIFFASGGRVGKQLFNELLEGAVKRRYDKMKDQDKFTDHMIKQFTDINKEDPKWIKFLLREALDSGKFEALEGERKELIKEYVEDIKERQRKGLVSKDVEPEYLTLLMFAVSFYPRIFGHVTKTITGLDASDPEFERKWSAFLSAIAKKFEID